MSRISIERVGEVGQVFSFDLYKHSSKHDYLKLEFQVLNNQFDEWKENLNKKIQIDYHDDLNQSVKTVFIGKITNINLYFNEEKYLCWNCRLEAYSETIFLDQESKTVIYQDVEKTASTVLTEIYKKYGYDVIIENDFAIPDILIQDNETDWQFICKIAKQHQMKVFSNAEDYVTSWIGYPDRRCNNIFGKIVAYQRTENGKICIFRSNDLLDLGDYVKYEQELKPCYVEGIHMYYKGGMVFIDYELNEKDIWNDDDGYYNYILYGKVIALEGEGQDKGKIQVEFEEEKGICANPRWINWVSSYTNHSGGFYNMPDIGERVIIYVTFNGKQEVFASGCLRTESIPNTVSVTDKMFVIGEKSVTINEEGILLENKNNKIHLLDDKIEFVTEHGSIIVDDSIILKTDESEIEITSDYILLSIKEKNKIVLSTKNLEINSASDVIISGEKINMK